MLLDDIFDETNPEEVPETGEHAEIEESDAVSDMQAEEMENSAWQEPEESEESRAFREKVNRYFQEMAQNQMQPSSADEGAVSMDEEIGGLGFTGKDIQPVVEDIVRRIPEVQAAREMVRLSEEKVQQEAFSEELRKISALDPSVKTPEDLEKISGIEVFHDLVLNRGYALSDAFKIAQFDALLGSSRSAGGQEALNRVHTKSHLKPVSGVYGEEVTVPEDVLEEYRALNPDASEEEIKKHYQKSLKA